MKISNKFNSSNQDNSLIKVEKANDSFSNTGSLESSSSESQIYYSKPQYVLRTIAGESVLVSVGNGVADFCGVIMLNESARVIWNLLLNGATKEELVQALVNTFSISTEQAITDVDDSLELLTSRKMIICD